MWGYICLSSMRRLGWSAKSNLLYSLNNQLDCQAILLVKNTNRKQGDPSDVTPTMG
jgi:hypothetical protein